MAATQIKDGFNGGSDNQLKVNSDGSINVNGGGGGGTTDVNIHDSAGNNLTSTAGALNVNADIAVGFDTLTNPPGRISVGASSVQIFAPNPNRRYAHVVNNSGLDIYIQYSSAAILGQGIKLAPNTLYTIESNNLWLGSVNAVGVTTSQLIDILEGE